MDNKLVMISIAAVIGIIVLGSVLMPIMNDATATTDTFTNDGFYRMKEITTEESVTINWSYDKPFVFTIDGIDVTMPPGSTSGDIFPYTIFATDGWGMRFNAYSGGTAVDLNLYDSVTNSLVWYAQSSNNDVVTITLIEGTAKFVITGGATKTETYTQAFIPDLNGDYILKKGTEAAYLNGDSLIYATGRTTLNFGSNVALNINLTGNIDDGETVTILAPSSGYTASNVEIDATAVNDHQDLYKFNKVTFDVTDTNSVTAGAIYSQVIVPYEVTAERSVHFTAGQNAIFAAIPVMIILAVLLGVVALVIRSRMD